MRSFLWMGIFLLFSGDNHRDYIVEDNVEWFELNHCYDVNAKLKFDQVILWEWSFYTEGRERKRQAVVVTWYMLDKKYNREQLTPDEYRAKNIEFRDQWVADKKKGTAPDYIPKFMFNHRCPRYDVFRGKWVAIINIRNRQLIKVYATSYVETWTQFDPEQENQKILPSNDRRKLCQQ